MKRQLARYKQRLSVFDLHDEIHTKKVIWIGFGVLFLLAILSRISLVDFKPTDYDSFSYWYDYVNTHGLESFKDAFSNYNPPYTYFLYILVKLPLAKIVALKWLLFLFDIFLASAVYYLVKLVKPKNYMPEIAALTTLFLPTVAVTGVMWGQFDNLYAGAMLFSLYFALLSRSRWAWAWFGIAISIKFQAIFFLPMLGILCFKKIKLHDIYWGVISFAALTLPPMLQGRSFSSLIQIYPEQTKAFTGYLTLGAPNIYQWVPNSSFRFFNEAGIYLAIAATVALLLIAVIYKKFKTRDILLGSTLMLYVVPFLLPAMHERYFFPAGIASVVLAFAYPSVRFIVLAVLSQLVTMFSYCFYLFSTRPVSFTALALVQLLIISVMLADYLGIIDKSESETTSAAIKGKPTAKRRIATSR